MEKPIIYIDIDGTIGDFEGAKKAGKRETDRGFYENLDVMPDALESVLKLAPYYDLYVLSTPAWSKPHSWMEKRLWIEKEFGDLFFKKVILSHRKDLLKGAYLIDDHEWNGAKEFDGELILFGSEKFPNWKAVAEYLIGIAEKEEAEGHERLKQFRKDPSQKGKGLGALLPEAETGGEQEYTPTLNKNTSNMSKPYEQVLKELKENIATQLNLCEEKDTPTVCSMKASADGYKKLEDMIIQYVADGGLTISQAIIEVERAYNINMLKD